MVFEAAFPPARAAAREVRKACQAKREAREKRPVRRGARKMAEVQAGEEEAFWKGKTIRVADAILGRG
jgi:hypothetical protein